MPALSAPSMWVGVIEFGVLRESAGSARRRTADRRCGVVLTQLGAHKRERCVFLRPQNGGVTCEWGGSSCPAAIYVRLSHLCLYNYVLQAVPKLKIMLPRINGCVCVVRGGCMKNKRVACHSRCHLQDELFLVCFVRVKISFLVHRAHKRAPWSLIKLIFHFVQSINMHKKEVARGRW